MNVKRYQRYARIMHGANIIAPIGCMNSVGGICVYSANFPERTPRIFATFLKIHFQDWGTRRLSVHSALFRITAL